MADEHAAPYAFASYASAEQAEEAFARARSVTPYKASEHAEHALALLAAHRLLDELNTDAARTLIDAARAICAPLDTQPALACAEAMAARLVSA
ncbi:MAG: hypothetical protein ACR2M3_09030 [Thermomicrobiales bacterium]